MTAIHRFLVPAIGVATSMFKSIFRKVQPCPCPRHPKRLALLFLPRGLLLLCLFQHFLDDLLLLNQERSHNPIPHAVAAS